MELEANKRTIADLERYFFVVPDYQREYVWKVDDEVEQFIVDLDNEFDQTNGKELSYFIGSIILVKDGNRWAVVDGQQRLTTIILAFCALRDVLEESRDVLDAKQKEYLGLVESFIRRFDTQSDDYQIRIELQYGESDGFLKQLVLGEEQDPERTPSIKRMDAAYKRFKEFFEGYRNQGLSTLVEFLKYFLLQVELVMIQSENLSSALKIFETINQRGTGLNAMDLVKNLLFREAKPNDFEKIKEIWKELSKNLERCKEGDKPLRFLRYLMMARYHDGILREDDIYKWIITKEGKAATKFEADPLKFAKVLRTASQRYADLVVATELQADGGEYPSVTRIGLVNKYRSRQHLILLLALGDNADTSEIEYLAAHLESLFFYSNSLKIQSKTNEALFAKWAMKLRGVDKLPALKKTVAELFIPYVKEKLGDFKSKFASINHYEYGPRYRERYILGRLESTVSVLAGLPEKGFDFMNNLQIEHILPQTPKNGVLPEEFEGLEDYNTYVYRLGNAILVESAINQAMNHFNDLKADWYEKKQNQLTKSDITTAKLLGGAGAIGKNTKQVHFVEHYKYQFPTWDKAAIDKRQRILLDLAFETWKFDGKRIDKI